MPSKSKKQSKTPSSSSKFQSLSQQSNNNNNNSSSPQQNHTQDDEFLHKTLEQASSKFPNFLSNSSLIAQISEFDSSSQQKGSIIWLSHASMLSLSISPASLVSVSVPSLSSGFRSDFPLRYLAEECSEQFGVDLDGEMDNKAGNFFALATAFPSNKLVKNGVRISSNLSYSLGCPTLGRTVFVHPIRSGSLNSYVHSNGSRGSHVDRTLLCEELYIRLISSRSLAIDIEVSSPSKKLSNGPTDRYENGEISSPRTPLSQNSRPCSPSPSKSSLVSMEGSVSCLRENKRPYFDSVEIQEVLRDKNAKKLLQHTAVSWLHSRTLLCGNLVMVPILSRLCLFEVVSMKSSSADGVDEALVDTSRIVQHTDDAYVINQATRVNICLKSDLTSETREESVSESGVTKSRGINVLRDEVVQLGGLQKEYTLLRDIISSSMKNALSSLGLRATKGVLLHGPPGTGKTSLAQLCAHDAGVRFFKVNGPEVISQYHGESEQALHGVFKSASEAAPSVIFIDELDAIAPARKEGGDELSQRLVATLLNLMDGMSRLEGLLIIAATNRVECIEPALRRPGRLDREIELGVPSPDQRFDILTTVLSGMKHSLSFDQIQELAILSHGFVGADLAALSNEAAMVCLRRCIASDINTDAVYARSTEASLVSVDCYSNLRNEMACDRSRGAQSSTNMESTISSDSIAFPICEEGFRKHNNREVVEDNECSSLSQDRLMKITVEDFEKARMKIRPSAMREVVLEVPKVKWKDVGGQDEVKAQLMEAVEWPQKHQDAFKRIGTRPPTGVLLFGPPGCSKTLIARAVASEAGLNFLAVKGPELFSKWVGESEKAVRSLFAKARANAPSIIFFDEIDSLAVIRGRESDGVSVADRVMSQLLVELDGLQERVNVTVIAATNRPDKIDPALLRPGRFDRLLYVGPPSEKDRVDVFRIHLSKMPCSPDVNLTELARLTEGCTGADISLVCREAAISAIEENLDASEINMEHLERAIRHVRPSEIQPYQHLSEKFQRLVHSKTPSEDIVCHQQLSETNASPSWFPFKWISRPFYWLRR
ncbi:hypothetical protein RND81_14G042900 [Saponaria officinalis]|uniref:AAA+ ATPase domain-containing protein n=2 Tax=Saponaria officinalis TaxID=3572 RepID=A0AAW1GKT5_SAPOF